MNQNCVRINSVQQWREEVLNHEKPVVVSFYADWCNPCSKLNPMLQEEAEKNNGKWKLALVDVDIEELEEIVRVIAKSKIPSVLNMKKGTQYDCITGFGVGKTREFLQKVNAEC